MVTGDGPVVAYRTEEGLPWVLPVVKTVEAQMSTDPMLNHEYLPLDGLKSFTEAAAKLLLGSDSPAFTQNRVCRSDSFIVSGLSSSCTLQYILANRPVCMCS